MLSRRKFLAAACATALASSPVIASGLRQRKKLLVFTRSAGFQHDVVKMNKGNCVVHSALTDLAVREGLEVECTKDGRVFTAGNIEKYDAFFFYTTGDLTAEKSADGSPPMPKEGKKLLLDAVASGKGFVGSHCASDTFHSPGGRYANSAKDIDPYIAMLGGEFIGHGAQQPGKLRVTSPRFPGVGDKSEIAITEEWYSLKNQPKDLHVVLVQETAGMKGHDYARPAFPSTWARKHEKGRVFYTSLGHREDVWASEFFRSLLVGGIHWAMGQSEFDPQPNIAQVTPAYDTLPTVPPAKGK
ncbi:MAG: ThuA domain-containing protein [Gemmataceae bacterium]|nr:ThuA domain-containing protein [Gemmataceae bacterium]